MEDGIVMVRKWLLALLCCWSYGAAQSNVWPGSLTVPAPEEKTADSSSAKLTSDMTVFGSYQKTRNDFVWHPRIASVQLQQRFLFETSSDITSDAMNQYYDLSGSVIKQDILPQGGSLGLEWTPTSRLNLRGTGSALQTTGDFGPVMQWNLYNAPILIHGGMSGTGWSNELPSRIFNSSMEQVHGDAGYYGGVTIGNPAEKLFGQPLYVSAEAFGRSIKQTGLATVTGAGLVAADCGSGDSLFVYYGDSLSDGKENIWGGSPDQLPFINTPWRIARSMQAAGGLKAKDRFGLIPAVMYAYADNSVSYPKISESGGDKFNSLSDVRERAQTLNFLLGTRDGPWGGYAGGIRFTWGAEEWLHGKDLSIISSSFFRTQLQRDSLNAKLGDHQKYSVGSDHYLGITLPHSVLFEYKLAAFRDSKTYTFSYRHGDNGEDTVRNNNDFDRITINNHCGFKVQNIHDFDVELFGELTSYILNNLRAERSAENYTEKGYRLGATLTYKPLKQLVFSENIVADAEIAEYLYKQNHQYDPPTYQRRVFSICTGAWKPVDAWEVKGKWNEGYYDNGKWYGREYRDSGRVDFYAIESKTFDYSVELSLANISPSSRIEGGCLFQDIFGQRFIGSSYEITNRGVGYLIEPFMEVRMRYRRLAFKTRIARMINTEAPDRWDLKNNWDLHLIGQATW